MGFEPLTLEYEVHCSTTVLILLASYRMVTLIRVVVVMDVEVPAADVGHVHVESLEPDQLGVPQGVSAGRILVTMALNFCSLSIMLRQNKLDRFGAGLFCQLDILST